MPFLPCPLLAGYPRCISGNLLQPQKIFGLKALTMRQLTMFCRLFNAHLWALVSLLALNTFSNAAALQPISSLAGQVNLTSLTLSLNASSSDYHCTRSRDWIAPAFEPVDCVAAIDSFREYEEKRHRHDEYEFIYQGAKPGRWYLKPQMLPRQYRSSS